MSSQNQIVEAVEKGLLLPESAKNLGEWKKSPVLPDWARDTLDELIAAGEWDELNDRFYQYMVFGTGGMRGRTIGKVSGSKELGDGGANNPAHAAVGSNVLNDFNVARSTIGLFRHTASYLKGEGRDYEVPALVIAHDIRFFSRHFCELAASVWSRLGGQAYIFDGPRSTPQLSFSVRFLRAHTGVVITASHNPPHDNGFKAYFEDGAQIVSPHAEGIVDAVGRVQLDELKPYLEIDLERVVVLSKTADDAYLKVLQDTVLDRQILVENQPKVVFTCIHGTGRISTIPLLQSLGLNVSEVAEQAIHDPLFPTVQSPNPENAEALAMAIAQAKEEKADLVLATDPDCDRMGVAVRRPDGEMQLLTGNMIGSILAEFRISQLREKGLLPEGEAKSSVLIKTFVTTPLQEKIGLQNGLKVIDTLTGFKWIGAKLRRYENELREELWKKEGLAIDYDKVSYTTRVKYLQKYSTFYVFGGEESYGYLANDLVRDKDANAAVLMFCELAAHLKKTGQTVLEYLDSIYLRYGYYLEKLGNVYYEGAAGARKIAHILESYRKNPPREMNGVKITKVIDFGVDTIQDADEEKIPSQDFYMVHLDNGFSYAVRGSGTEPKIKFYVFGHQTVKSEGDLPLAKQQVGQNLDALREAIEKDAAGRAG